MIQLRPYQSSLISEIIRLMSERKYRRIAAYLSQGGGKSLVAAYMAINSVKKGNKVLILTHRQKILEQNFSKIEGSGVIISVINRNTKDIQDADCYVAMSQTLTARIKEKEEWREFLKTISFCIIDELHRAEHDKILETLPEKCFFVGLSATILRSGNSSKQLGNFYDYIVKTSEAKDLIELGYLLPSRNFIMQAPKIDGIEISRSTGDYDAKKLQKVYQKSERYSGIVKEYLRLVPDTKAIVFTTGVEHCVDLCIQFNEMGIKAKYIVSNRCPETDAEYSGKAEKVLEQYARGEFKVICNVFTLDTGFDCPDIETVILDFSTASYARYAQAAGRGSRPCLGLSHFNVLDFGDNVSRFGEFERSNPPMGLWHNTSEGGIMATKECKECLRLVPVSAKQCSYCGYVFPTERSIYEAELTEFVNGCSEEKMPIEIWIAQKVLDGWSNNRILMSICVKNSDNPKKAYMEAIPYLRTKEGGLIDPKSWFFFSKYVLNKNKK